ncbi:MAG: hypothetical protein O3C28_13215 [Proteobacteria bacterium]|nr:hypothetical protein [Pseudomonadota bacterium]
MELDNYEPSDAQIKNEFDDPTVALFDDSGLFEFDSLSAHLNPNDVLEMGDFVQDAFDAATHPNYSDS